mmetsp:Transcript_16479/g.40245  ORF Transcript_16479/g.40245 Transcript_16479/m.40245 type:complete len:395 (-) Transcript_16479:18-1202(-)
MDEPNSKRRRTNLIVIKDEEGSTTSSTHTPSAPIRQDSAETETTETPIIPAAVPSNSRVRQRSNSTQNHHNTTTNINKNQNNTSRNNQDDNSNSQQQNDNVDSQTQQNQQQQEQQQEEQQQQRQRQQQLEQEQQARRDSIIRPLLRELRTGRTVDDALTAIERLYHALMDKGTSSSTSNTTGNNNYKDSDLSVPMARCITQWNGCGAILMALKDWYLDSTDFASKAVKVLVLVTGAVPIAKQFIVELGGLRTLIKVSEGGLHVFVSDKTGGKVPKQLTVVQRKRLDYRLQSNVVGLLHNLIGGVDYSIGKEVAAEECLDLVIQALKSFPDDKYTQKRGIRYLLKVGRMQDSQVTMMLQKKQVGILFVQALDRFRNTNPGVKEMAQEALLWYATS